MERKENKIRAGVRKKKYGNYSENAKHEAKSSYLQVERKDIICFEVVMTWKLIGIYIYIYIFERIEHSGIRYCIKCKQTNAAAVAT